MNVSVTTRVQEILERGAGAGRGVVEMAWDHLDEPHIVRELYAVLRRRDPKTAMESTRVKFLEEDRYRREGKIYRREMYETVEALGATSAHWLPYFIAHADLAAFSLVLGRLGDPRAISVLFSKLTTAKGPLLAAVIDALGRLRAIECVDELIAIAHSALPLGERERVGHRRTVANACLALGRIGDSRATLALLDLVIEPPPEMESVVPRAIIALGWLGDGEATHALLPLLEGRYRNVSMYALARIADRSSTAHVEATCARLTGRPEQIVYPRTMLEALRSRLGRSVDVEVARFALQVVMASRFEATELHETALRMLAVHGKPEEVARVARKFIDAETPRVRAAAVAALASVGTVVSPSWLDRPRVDEMYRREGVRGLARALADPESVFRHNVIRKAAEMEAGAELEGPALGALRVMVSFPFYSEESVVDRSENAFDALESLARFHTALADQFLVAQLDHSNVMFSAAVQEIAKVDVYGASEHLREALRRRVEERGAPRPTLPVTRLGGGPWVFGPPIRKLSVDRSGTRVLALGDEKVVLFDADGTLVASREDLEGAVASAFERNGERVAIAFPDGRVVVLEARSGETLAEHHLEGATGATAVAFAADGQIVVGTSKRRLVKGAEHTAWSVRMAAPVVAILARSDTPQLLVAMTDRLAWIDGRDGSHRASTKRGNAIRDVALHTPTHQLAVVRRDGIEVLDEETLEQKRRVAVLSATCAAFAREGRVMVAVTGGRSPGLVRIDQNSKRAVRIVRSTTPIHGLATDPMSSLVLTGGDGVRVDLWDADGTSSSLPIAQHGAPVVAVVADVARGRAFTIGADDVLLQWDIAVREVVAGWRLPTRGGVVGAALGATGRALTVVTGREVCVLDLVTGHARWRRVLTGATAMAATLKDTWVLCPRGLVSVEEGSNRVRVLAPLLKRGLLASLDDRRLVIVHGHGFVAVDRKSGEVLQTSVLGRGRARALLADANEELGLVVTCDDRTLRRFAGSPLEPAGVLRLATSPEVLATDPPSARVAFASGREVVVVESDLRERARVTLDHHVCAMAFAEHGLLVCGGSGGEVSLIETER